MNEKKVNVFAIPVLTFMPNSYRKLVKESGGKIFLALLIWFIVLHVISCIPAMSGINDFLEMAKKECPEFDISNGRLSMPESYKLDSDGRYYEIDEKLEDASAARVEEIIKSGKYDSVMLVGRESVSMYSNGRIQVLKYSDIPGFSLSKDSLCNRWLPLIKPFLVAVYVVIAFFAIGIYYLAALILQFVAGILAKGIHHTEFDFSTRFKITLLAKFPVYAIVFIGKEFNLSVSFLVNVICQIAVIACMLYFYCKNDQESGMREQEGGSIV